MLMMKIKVKKKFSLEVQLKTGRTNCYIRHESALCYRKFFLATVFKANFKANE